MAKAFTVDINQLTQLQKRVQDMESGLKKRVSDMVIFEMQEAVNQAKRGSPIDTGRNRNSITRLVETDRVGIVAQTKYAAYLEFGTGSGVQVPSELNEIAAQFKGRGIRTTNMKARPYLYPAFLTAIEMIKKRLPKIILNR